VNFAFPALLIFLLALPGIILRYAFRKGFFWDRPRTALPITEEVAYSLVIAALLHAVYGGLVDLYLCPIDLPSIARLLLGQYGKDSALLDATTSSITRYPIRILAYFASLYGISGALGYLAHWIVRRTRADIRYPALRFDHQWHYLLRGEIADFAEATQDAVIRTDAVPDEATTMLACFVESEAGTFLYVGPVDSFYFDKSGELELIVLRGAMRRKIDADFELSATSEQRAAKYYFINADYVYLKYSEIKNISLRFVHAQVPESNKETADPPAA
jgi:hypothetical protein